MQLISSFDSAMLVTRGTDGALHARPMRIAETTEQGTVTFLTDIGSNKSWEVIEDERVALTFQRVGAYMSVTGTARVQRDPKRTRQLWKGLTNPWFDGPEDPCLGVIQVKIRTAEYWDHRGINSLRFAMDVIRANLTDSASPPESDPRQHRVVSMG